MSSQALQDCLAEVTAFEAEDDLSLAEMKKRIELALHDLHDSGEDVQLFLMQLIKEYGGDPNNPPPQYAHLAFSRKYKANFEAMKAKNGPTVLSQKQTQIMSMVSAHQSERKRKIDSLKRQLLELDTINRAKIERHKAKKRQKKHRAKEAKRKAERKAKEWRQRQKRQKEKAANKRKKMKAKQRMYKQRKKQTQKVTKAKGDSASASVTTASVSEGKKDALAVIYDEVLLERQKQIAKEQTNESQKQTNKSKKKRKRKKKRKKCVKKQTNEPRNSDIICVVNSVERMEKISANLKQKLLDRNEREMTAEKAEASVSIKDLYAASVSIEYDYSDVNEAEYDYSDSDKTDAEIGNVMREINASLECETVITNVSDGVMGKEEKSECEFVYHLPDGLVSDGSESEEGNCVLESAECVGMAEVRSNNCTKDLVKDIWETYDGNETYKNDEKSTKDVWV